MEWAGLARSLEALAGISQGKVEIRITYRVMGQRLGRWDGVWVYYVFQTESLSSCFIFVLFLPPEVLKFPVPPLLWAFLITPKRGNFCRLPPSNAWLSKPKML